MSAMVDYFLRAKHWQLFFLFSGVLCATGIAMGMAALSTGGWRAIRVLYWVGTGIFEISFLAWLWSLGSFLTCSVRPALRLNVGFFLFSLIYPPLYLSAFIVFFQNPVPLLLFPLHVLAMFCMLYSIYFVSKSLILAESGESVSFYDYAGSFFLIWFFPIGVWVVQPRINRLYVGKKNAELLAIANAG